jgi:hypothetical protein
MVELNARDDFDGDDDYHCHVDDKAERRPLSFECGDGHPSIRVHS